MSELFEDIKQGLQETIDCERSRKQEYKGRNVLVTKEEKYYVVTDVASNVASQGLTVEEAFSNFEEALELFLHA